MFILTIVEGSKNDKDQAYASTNKDGSKSLSIFVDKDDAVRYAGLLEADNHPAVNVTEIPDEEIIKTCEMMGYKYQVITPDEFVIPRFV
tara:strand:+ start:681 stop:947 length:267 start_codon:yes stop_codon:yes gene_type:complete